LLTLVLRSGHVTVGIFQDGGRIKIDAKTGFEKQIAAKVPGAVQARQGGFHKQAKRNMGLNRWAKAHRLRSPCRKVAAFTDRSILVKTTGYQRNRSFVFKEYVGMFQ
jgi:hypothetical protein